MTGGQAALLLGGHNESSEAGMTASPIRQVDSKRPALKVIRATTEELKAHEQNLEKLGDACIWNSEAKG